VIFDMDTWRLSFKVEVIESRRKLDYESGTSALSTAVSLRYLRY